MLLGLQQRRATSPATMRCAKTLDVSPFPDARARRYNQDYFGSRAQGLNLHGRAGFFVAAQITDRVCPGRASSVQSPRIIFQRAYVASGFCEVTRCDPAHNVRRLQKSLQGSGLFSSGNCQPDAISPASAEKKMLRRKT